MQNYFVKKSIMWGLVATTILLAVYFTVVSLISGISFATSQFSQNWYFIISLAIGFGIQITLYSYLRQLIKNHSLSLSSTKNTVVITGTTSTLSMISCCAHYLVNIIPILGIAGILSVVGEYQIQLFWIGLFFNFIGILYVSRQIIRFKKQT